MKRLLAITAIAILLVAQSDVCSGQWKQCIGPGDHLALCVASIDSDVFVGTSEGLFRTTDHGVTWGIVSPPISSYVIRSLAVQDSSLFVLVGEVLWYDNANTNDSIYGHEGLYRVTQHGALWTKIDQALPFDSLNAIAVCNSILYCWVEDYSVNSPNEVPYQSTDLGEHWSRTLPLSDGYFLTIAADQSGRTMLAGIADPYLSTDSGSLWSPVHLPDGNNGFSLVTSSFVLDSMLYIGAVGQTLGNNDNNSFAFVTSVQTAEQDIATQNGYQAWKRMTQLDQSNVEKFLNLGPTLFAVCNSGSQSISGPRWFAESTDGGTMWYPRDNGTDFGAFSSIAVCGKDVYAVGRDFDYGRTVVYRSTDTGNSWQPVSRSLRAQTCLAVGAIGPVILTCSQEGLLRSSDRGGTWQAVGTGLRGPYVNTFFADGPNIFAGSDSGTFISSDSGMSWTECDQGMRGAGGVYAFARIGGTLFAGTVGYRYGTPTGNLYFSTDNGSNWTPTSAITIGPITALTTHNDTLFVAGLGIAPVFTIDAGKSWSKNNQSIGNVTCMALTHSGLFAGTGTPNGSIGSIWHSTDGDHTWTEIDGGVKWNNLTSLVTDGKNLFASTHDSGAFVSTNDGSTWQRINQGLDFFFGDYNGSNLTFYSLLMSGDDLFAGTETGIWLASIADIVGPSANVSQSSPKEQSMMARPNPFTRSTMISFASQNEGYADVTVVNLLGQQVARIFSGELAAGGHSFSWDANGMPPGMYECIVRINGRLQQIPMILERN